MTAKTTTERVNKLRAARAAAGLVRLELYVHPADWPAIKALADKLQRERAATDVYAADRINGYTGASGTT